jgi:hypothetical protein
MSMKNSNDTIGNRSHDLPVCSAVPQPLRHRVPHKKKKKTNSNVHIYVEDIVYSQWDDQEFGDRRLGTTQLRNVFRLVLKTAKKGNISFVICPSVRPSVCPRETTRLPLEASDKNNIYFL